MKEKTNRDLAHDSSFAQLGIEPRFVEALAKFDIVTPSEIQAAMIPPVLEGRDVVGQARTGTGKTIAFALPILQRTDPKGGVQAICLTPTRELAVQVAGEVDRVAFKTPMRAVAIYGGQRVRAQVARLNRRPQFVAGTPGRVLDLLARGVLDMSELRAVVLDEVDRMFDIGFRDDIRRILRQFKTQHQTIVVSATVTDPIKGLIRQHTRDPIWLDVSRDSVTVDEIDQCYVTVDSHDKFQLLKCLLKEDYPELAIIFTNTKGMARRLAKRLHDAGYKAAEIHGDLRQQVRMKVMERFRRQHIHLLIATDLAARGIDVDDVSHIINYDIPEDPEIYVHRIGRTARMGKTGKAITLVTRGEGKPLTAIEMIINKLIPCRTVDSFVPTERESPARH